MLCCLNPDCEKPLNQDSYKFCLSCGTKLPHRLRNRFKIIKPLGRGGFGKTYLAEDADKLNGACVIKQLFYQGQSSNANQKIVELFMREAEQLNRLKANQQIPDLLAYFEEDGFLYLAQEYVEGQDLLKELQQEGAFNESKIKAFLLDLLPVLEFIHDAGLVHRDLKPDNIMRRHNDGRLALIDFGVARQLSMSQSNVTGTKVGSPGYFSMEQFAEGKASASSDLYSLGATAFHLLTGQYPGELWTMQGYAWVNKWQDYFSHPMELSLLAVLNKLLQIKAEDRYQSASAVLSDLASSPPPNPQAPTTPIHSQYPSFHSSEPVPQSSASGPVSSFSSAAKSPFKRNRRRFLTLAIFGGVGLGSGLAWKIIRDGSVKPTSSPEEGFEPLWGSPSPDSGALPAPQSSLNVQRFNFEVVSVDEKGTIVKRDQSQAQFFSEDIGNGISLEMVAIPDGTFLMGSPPEELKRLDRESPQHEVNVPAFFLGKYPVTQAQWEAIVGSNPSKFKFTGANRPVENISWEDAVEFCNKLSKKSGKAYRLPSEAEWEYACRAGTTTPFYFGETMTTELANYRGTDYSLRKRVLHSGKYHLGPLGKWRQQTTAVGLFLPNDFGLYDMHGNVWEFCQDYKHENYIGAPTDGSAWIRNSDNLSYIKRGGSWSDFPKNCRSASRSGINPGNSGDHVGFRLALSAPISS